MHPSKAFFDIGLMSQPSLAYDGYLHSFILGYRSLPQSDPSST